MIKDLKLQVITGLSKEAVVKSMAQIPPELSSWIIEFAYGKVLSRRQLDLRTRQLGKVAALTAMGTAPAQLKGHIKGALNEGCTNEQVIKIIQQMAVYAGFPSALNGGGYFT